MNAAVRRPRPARPPTRAKTWLFVALVPVAGVALYTTMRTVLGVPSGGDPTTPGIEAADEDPGLDHECSSPEEAWIWCDDFEVDRLGSYFEYQDAGGRFARRPGAGLDGSWAMGATFTAGGVDAGSLKLAFGRTPTSYMAPVDAGTGRIREIYWRVYVMNEAGWTGGGGYKLSRATVFATDDWAQAAVAHVWSGEEDQTRLGMDPVSGTDALGNLRTTTYNDFDNFRWLGHELGTTPLFASDAVGQWYCVEARMRLNDPGASNGAIALWIDGEPDISAGNLDFLGSYSEYGINAVIFEGYWNGGSPKRQTRYLDNIVVSRSRIGCGE